MPELPEVETVRRGLVDYVVGRRIAGVEVTGRRTVRRTSAAEVIAGLTDATFTGFDRRGKYLVGHLDSGADVMLHLRMSGQIVLAPAAAPPPVHAHVVLHFDPTAAPVGQLWFIDPRTFGEVVVFEPEDAELVVPELARLGIDPIADPFTRRDLATIVRSRSRAMKALLVDQHLVAGIGNIYADEILHRARIHPERSSSSLSSASITRLYHAIGDVLTAAIEARGSTLADSQYVDLMGRPGEYQNDHVVYGHADERCRTCGRGIIRRITAAGRSTHFCPVCQRPERPRRTTPATTPRRLATGGVDIHGTTATDH